jgi:CheY-like chemotaxis protein
MNSKRPDGNFIELYLAGRKVLLVDDDADVRRTVAALLSDLGCVPDEASCGADALTRLEASTPDAVVTDYAMPGMTGPSWDIVWRRSVRTCRY